MGATRSYHSYDYKPIHMIPVIASFDTTGHVAPLYVRLGEDILKVEEYWVKYAFANLMEFHCKVRDKDQLKPLLLTYHQTESIWSVPV